MALTVMPRNRPGGSPVRSRRSKSARVAATHQAFGSNMPGSAPGGGAGYGAAELPRLT